MLDFNSLTHTQKRAMALLFISRQRAYIGTRIRVEHGQDIMTRGSSFNHGRVYGVSQATLNVLERDGWISYFDKETTGDKYHKYVSLTDEAIEWMVNSDNSHLYIHVRDGLWMDDDDVNRVATLFTNLWNDILMERDFEAMEDDTTDDVEPQSRFVVGDVVHVVYSGEYGEYERVERGVVMDVTSDNLTRYTIRNENGSFMVTPPFDCIVKADYPTDFVGTAVRELNELEREILWFSKSRMVRQNTINDLLGNIPDTITMDELSELFELVDAHNLVNALTLQKIYKLRVKRQTLRMKLERDLVDVFGFKPVVKRVTTEQSIMYPWSVGYMIDLGNGVFVNNGIDGADTWMVFGTRSMMFPTAIAVELI